MRTFVLLFFCTLLCAACGSQKINSKKTTPVKSSSQSSEDTGGRQPQILVNSYAFLIKDFAADGSYGYTPEDAVEVGGASEGEGPLNERRFLNALAGPNGEEINYHRLGSCCAVPSPNSSFGKAVLDQYAVYYENAQDTVVLYINMYDSEKLLVPKGFSIRSFPN